jgi:phosphomannomutase
VEQSDAIGGISVTASHNPIEWNGLKFMGSSGQFLDVTENKELQDILGRNDLSYVPWNLLGSHSAADFWLGRHIDTVCALKYLDRALLKKRRFKVVADCVNAAGGEIVPKLLRELGCDVIELNCDMSGVFAHPAEPLPENLTELASRVKLEKADLGIAVDPDVDRLVLITERGEPYGEEYTVASAVKFILERSRAREKVRPDEDRDKTSSEGRGERLPARLAPASSERAGKAGRRERVVVNLSTTRAVDDIAAEYGAEVIRTPVGELNVVKRMKEVGAIIGGEGSGGVILPEAHLGRDALVGIGLILQMLADFGGTLSDLKASLPSYAIAKDKIELGSTSPGEILRNLEVSANSTGRINTDDGLRIDYENHWVHFRKSNTEPIIRVIAEARTTTEAKDALERMKNEIATGVQIS